MIRFKFKDYEIHLHDWSKHHKTVGVRVKRVYDNGEIIWPKDEKLKKFIKENESILKPKRVSLYDSKTDRLEPATDYFLPVHNVDYQEANLEYYDVGAANTSQTIYMRLTFQLEDYRFILDYSFKSSGSYATSFYDVLDYTNFVESIIEEVLESEKTITDVGIEEGIDADYNVVVVNVKTGEITDIEVEKRELLKSLIGVEVYKFDMKIDGKDSKDLG